MIVYYRNLTFVKKMMSKTMIRIKNNNMGKQKVYNTSRLLKNNRWFSFKSTI